jgi:hypothetical protein
MFTVSTSINGKTITAEGEFILGAVGNLVQRIIRETRYATTAITTIEVSHPDFNRYPESTP